MTFYTFRFMKWDPKFIQFSFGSAQNPKPIISYIFLKDSNDTYMIFNNFYSYNGISSIIRIREQLANFIIIHKNLPAPNLSTKCLARFLVSILISDILRILVLVYN